MDSANRSKNTGIFAQAGVEPSSNLERGSSSHSGIGCTVLLAIVVWLLCLFLNRWS